MQAREAQGVARDPDEAIPSPGRSLPTWGLPILAPTVMVVLLWIVERCAVQPKGDLSGLSRVTEAASPLHDIELRATWGVGWAALVAVSLTAAALGLWLLLGVVRRTRCCPIRWILQGTGLFAVGAWLLSRFGQSFGDQITRNVLPGRLLDDLGLLLPFSSTLAALATGLVAAAAAAVCREHALAGGDTALGAAAAQRRIKLLLYASAAVLLVGAVEVRQLLSLPLAWTSSAARQAELSSLAANGSTAMGLLGSLLLVAIFLPALVLVGLGTRSAEPNAPREGDEAGEVAPPPQGSRTDRLLEVLKLLAAVLAPLLGTWTEQALS